KALRDARHFLAELSERQFPVGSLVLNRVWPRMAGAVAPEAPPQIREMTDWYEMVCRSHHQIREEVSRTYGGRIPRIITLPEMAADLDGLPALYQLAGYLA
ncbi:MAG TPA: hypothetical protein VNN17_13160, partial [Terriglobia bacterium]|nr:hypothetical protein [Terriglobia bacterium]